MNEKFKVLLISFVINLSRRGSGCFSINLFPLTLLHRENKLGCVDCKVYRISKVYFCKKLEKIDEGVINSMKGSPSAVLGPLGIHLSILLNDKVEAKGLKKHNVKHT